MGPFGTFSFVITCCWWCLIDVCKIDNYTMSCRLMYKALYDNGCLATYRIAFPTADDINRSQQVATIPCRYSTGVDVSHLYMCRQCS